MIRTEINLVTGRTYIGGREAEKSEEALPFFAPLSQIVNETEFSFEADVPQTDDESEYWLEFSTLSATAEIFVNGENAGTHGARFTLFRLNVTKYLTPGEICSVKVIVHPLARKDDKFIFGKTSLITVPVSHFELNNMCENAITVHTAVSQNACDVHVLAPVCNSNNYDVVSFVLTAPDGEVFTKTCKPTEAECTFSLSSPFIWGGQNESHLYSVKAYLQRDSVFLDETETVFGIKRMRFKNSFFCLNEMRLPLNGVHFTNLDSTPEDTELFNQLDANCIMLDTVPADTEFLCDCDKNGSVVWLDLSDTEFTDANELAETVSQLRNHPSVCFISFNETSRAEAKKLCDTVKNNSDGIFTALKYNFPFEENECIAIPDVLALKISETTLPEQFSALGNRLDEFRAEHPGYRLAVLASSPECIYSRHSIGAVRNDCSQEFFSLWHERLWNTFGTKKDVIAFFAGSLTDKTKKSGRTGLVTADRDDKKDAFWFYKSQFSADGFVKLCSGGITQCAEKYIDIKCYTNTPPINITVNGKTKKEYRGNETSHCVYEFSRIKLKRRNNTIVISASGGTDSAVIFRSKSKLTKK